jgi:MerR family transcriptional regulator, light-induced transcriptional regulator
MKAENRQRAHQIDAVSKPLTEWIANLHTERDPSIETRYGDDGFELWRHEIRVRLMHLAEAVAADRPELFVQNALWSRAAFLAREVDTTDLKRNLECTKDVCEQELPVDVAPTAARFIADAITALEQGPADPLQPAQPDASEGRLSRLYLLHLLQRNQTAAANLVFEAAREGKSVPEIYQSILTPALGEVGRMWHLQEATVADEHYCTAATQMIMAQLRARMQRKPSNGKRVLAMAVGGDLHDIGIRMVADLFEAEGWATEYLGANMPTSEVLVALADPNSGKPAFDLIAVSANTTLSVRAVASFIEAVRQHPTAGSTPIVVGGGAFRSIPDLWQVVGADGFAKDASSALRVAEQLVSAS